ncbi:MAG: HAD hydrolase family protein [Planctomycetaceae bacterium]|jgi:3-deoxy-D-manno-octulosonate 8-phosphate phosphatase (KDO 8-P phosphatase)|nr:HAD hydrolase family protein [Planctomycetaceae bacterium]
MTIEQIPTTIAAKAKQICMILSDVDGILTDGTIEIDHLGNESKRFSTLDGYGIRLWFRSGYKFGLITGRRSECVLHRARDLGVDIVRLGTFAKREAVEEIAAEHHLGLERIAYIGDDLPDLPAIRAVGFGVTVPGASEELKRAADYITKRPGGYGAVRDLIELILKLNGKWNFEE